MILHSMNRTPNPLVPYVRRHDAPSPLHDVGVHRQEQRDAKSKYNTPLQPHNIIKKALYKN
jgi:hypothetical protein